MSGITGLGASLPKRTRQAGRGKTFTKIYDKAYTALLEKLEHSCREANNAYGPDWEEHLARPGNPVQKTPEQATEEGYGSKLWKPVYIRTEGNKQNRHPETDEIEVVLKVGKAIWKGQFGGEDSFRCVGKDLPGIMAKIETQIKKMKPDSEMGKSFHAMAIEQARPPRDKKIINDGGSEADCEWEYMKKYDLYVPRDEEKRKERLNELKEYFG